MRGSIRWPVLLIGLTLVVCAVRLETVPPLWWDEGWTLSVARNWVETGHYGRYLLGEPISPRMAAAPTVVLPVALSFRLLGVGAWQGRLPSLVWTALALWLLYRLAVKLYDRRAGLLALVLALFTPMARDLHPVLMGKQVLGEVPGLCFLLGGYVLLAHGLRGRTAWPLAAAGVPWGLAALTKMQFVPFLALSIGGVAVALLRDRRWRPLVALAIAVVLAAAPWLAWRWVAAALAVPGARDEGLRGLLTASAAVLTLRPRLVAATNLVLFGLPTMAALVYAGRNHLGRGAEALPKLAVWLFCSGWLAWYGLLSVGWVRYLFPATFVGLIFLATTIGDALTLRAEKGVLVTWRGSRICERPRLARHQKWCLAFLVVSVPMCTLKAAVAHSSASDDAFRVAEHLKEAAAPDALIELYEPEIMFLIDQPYHFPPDQMSVEFIRRDQGLAADLEGFYDPLGAAPDYILQGRFSRMWMLYPEDLLREDFRLEKDFGVYQLFARRRP